MSPEEADAALAELSAESDRMADALLAMDTHTGHRLLSNATLAGRTQRRWTEATAAMSVLWEQFTLHRTLVEQAKEVRARRTRPSAAELAELTTLLTGPVVELNAEQVPIERRSLTGPAVATERITLTELVTTMKKSYAMITEVLAAAEKAWHSTIEQLEPLDAELRSVTALAGSLGVEDPVLGRITKELAEFRSVALSDPLSAVAPPQRLATELADFRTALDKVASSDERVRRIEGLIDELTSVQAEARAATATVLEKIASPGLPRLVDAVSSLRARLSGLPKSWRELSTALDDVERDADHALADARTQLRVITGLLDRRLELRGRLDAYRAKARRLGFVEDLDLGALHQEARELLYTIPCDLPAATRAVNRYQQALNRRGDQ